MEISGFLIDILANQFVDVGDIDGEKRLKEDLGYDSLTLVGLIIEIEEKAGIEFDISDLDPNKLVTVNDILALIDNATTG